MRTCVGIALVAKAALENRFVLAFGEPFDNYVGQVFSTEDFRPYGCPNDILCLGLCLAAAIAESEGD